MKTLLIAALVLAAAPAVAQTTIYSNGARANTYGNTTIYTSPTGQTTTANTYGNTTVYSTPGGQTIYSNTYPAPGQRR